MRAIILALALHICSAANITLSDDRISLGLASDPTSTTFGIPLCVSASDDAPSESLLDGALGATPLWSATWVTAAAVITTSAQSSDNTTRALDIGANDTSATFTWTTSFGGDGGAIDLTTRATVEVVGGLAQWWFAFETSAPGVGLWEWTCDIDGVALDGASSSLFENSGFGVVHEGVDNFGGGFAGAYPQKTLQFMAAYDARGPGVYFGTHDGGGASKTFRASVADGGVQLSLGVSVTPPDAGVARAAYAVEWPVVLAPFAGDWFDAAQLYRAWALAGADWTRQGPLSARTDQPPWLRNIT